MKSAQDAKKQNEMNTGRIRILYGEEVAVLPLSAAEAIGRASGMDCKILLCLAADKAAREGGDEARASFAEQIGCTVEEVERAIAYFRGAGVIDYAEPVQTAKKKTGRPKKQTPEEIIAEELKKRGADAPAVTASVSEEESEKQGQAEPREKKLRRTDELPNYTIDELSALLEERKNLSLFLDECQRAYGKMFNPREISKVLGMTDYLALSEEYVLTLLRYFGEMPEAERKPLHYIEKMAFSLYDSGITEQDALCEHLERLKLMKTNEGQIRAIFGTGTRAFSAKEKNAIMLWLGEYGSDMDLIRLAYDKTVNATGKPSILYAAKILERWYREGLKTPEEVEAAERKDDPPAGNGNFDTDDFFEAALRRSYGDAYEKLYQKKDPEEQ